MPSCVDGGSMLTHHEMIARIAIGAALGSVIGYERDRHKRPAGLRTHLLVALASATFMVVSSQFAYYQGFDGSGAVEVDASRIAASVVSAVGFLAGGAILHTGATVQGLTTAAALWLVTAIGLCAGSGMYVEAVFTTFVGILALTVFRRFEDKDNLVVRRRIALVLDPRVSVSSLVAVLAEINVVVSDIDYKKRLGESPKTSVSFVVRHAEGIDAARILEVLEPQAGVRRVHVQLRA